jgi:hypothetical protein
MRWWVGGMAAEEWGGDRDRVLERRWSWLASRVWVRVRGGAARAWVRKVEAVSAALGRVPLLLAAAVVV